MTELSTSTKDIDTIPNRALTALTGYIQAAWSNELISVEVDGRMQEIKPDVIASAFRYGHREDEIVFNVEDKDPNLKKSKFLLNNDMNHITVTLHPDLVRELEVNTIRHNPTDPNISVTFKDDAKPIVHSLVTQLYTAYQQMQPVK